MPRPGNPEAKAHVDDADAAVKARDWATGRAAAERALALEPGNCHAVTLRLRCLREQGEAVARDAAAWAKERESECRWSRYFRSEYAWAIYDGWVAPACGGTIAGKTYEMAAKGVRRVLELTDPREDAFVRNVVTLQFLKPAEQHADWSLVVEFTDALDPRSLDRERRAAIGQNPSPESDFDRWARRRARALRELGRVDEALDLAARADEHQPGSPHLARERGRCACAAGDHADGARRLEAVYRSAPATYYYVAGEIGDCLAAAGDPDAALRWYVTGIADAPPAFATTLAERLAVACEELGEVEAALRHHQLVWATAVMNQWGARATQARTDLRAFAERHEGALGDVAPAPQGPPPSLDEVRQACEAIWARWQAGGSAIDGAPGAAD